MLSVDLISNQRIFFWKGTRTRFLLIVNVHVQINVLFIYRLFEFIYQSLMCVCVSYDVFTFAIVYLLESTCLIFDFISDFNHIVGQPFSFIPSNSLTTIQLIQTFFFCILYINHISIHILSLISYCPVILN